MSNELIDVVILTILPEEYQAACSKISGLQPAPPLSDHANLYAWKVGLIPSGNSSYSVAVGMMWRVGTTESALATSDALKRWKPRYIFFVGIAGGLSGVEKGDVVVADVIHGYEYGKIEKKFIPRDNWTYKTDLGLLNGAIAHSRSEWKRLVSAKPPQERAVNVTHGEIASGDKVVDDPTNEFFAEICKTWPKTRAVEMEGAGAGNAIENAQALGLAVGFMMIRGISDLPRPPQPGEAKDKARGTQERDAWKNYAADNVAAFIISFISSGLPLPPRARTTASLVEMQVASMMASAKPGTPGVFISHRGADAELARRLAEEIRQAGYQVWFDEWEIGIGDSIVERINAGLEDAKYLIVCYSETGVLSPWMSREWMSTLARQLEGYRVKVLPARLSGGTPPAILADIRYADLVKDWGRGLNDLLRAMR